MVVSMAALLACIGLAIDAGYLELVKTRMQAAADAAALGGVQEIKQNGAAHAPDAAKSDASLNGFTDGRNSVTVTVNNPPVSGYYTADRTAVEVLISQNAGTLFMSLLGFSSSKVRARSVARQGSGADCLYTLDPSAHSAFDISGGATLTVNCGIMVDSNSDRALTASGGAVVNATSIDVAGNYTSSGGAVLSPAPVTGASPESDPLAYLTPPNAGACSENNWSVSGGASVSIGPGVYCGGITISGGSSVTLTAGTYILLGGGLSISGGSSLSGTGVTFYDTADKKHGYSGISVSGGTTIHLSAPTTGDLAGILFFQDPSLASPASSSFTGGDSTVLNGALYFPTSDVSYSGGAASNYTILVAKTVKITGGSTLNSNYSALPGGSPVRGNAVVSE